MYYQNLMAIQMGTCTDFSTFTTFKSLALGADKEELVDVDGDKVEFAPPPWLNRHFCCQVQSLVVTPATQCVKER